MFSTKKNDYRTKQNQNKITHLMQQLKQIENRRENPINSSSLPSNSSKINA